jgi:hypothetical protein
MVLFGGNDAVSNLLADTWTYAPTRPASWVAFGSGCSGSAGVPVLAPLGLPWLGAPFVQRIAPVPQNALALACLGVSRSQWNTTVLPLDLSPFGLPGCSLRVAPTVVLAVLGSGTVVDWTLQVPNTAALAGVRAFAQVFVLDAPANAAGVVVSNAGEFVLGGR